MKRERRLTKRERAVLSRAYDLGRAFEKDRTISIDLETLPYLKRFHESFGRQIHDAIIATDYTALELRALEHMMEGANEVLLNVVRKSYREACKPPPISESERQRQYDKIMNFATVYGVGMCNNFVNGR